MDPTTAALEKYLAEHAGGGMSDFAKYGLGGLLAGALLFLIYLVGSRIVAALDRVAVKVDGQGTAIGDLRSDVRGLEIKLDWAIAGETTGPIQVAPPEPVRRPRAQSPALGIPQPIGVYGPMRPSTRGGQ